ncbi:hypothetical protein [Absiella sp. AM29-15]|uniref:hypothetical protein n=1 Tax=Absiella sp. AM29-15 TaxID=2292278 RepID=UPI000E42B135|nr:hypothetical protein [Absiella sp. AM29-15]RGC44331.1 hypothetical protein DW761_19940 [Absiella sp. AM29-15]
MRKFVPPDNFKAIVANRLYGLLSIKSAAEICGITNTTYLKYEKEYRDKVSSSDLKDLKLK